MIQNSLFNRQDWEVVGDCWLLPDFLNEADQGKLLELLLPLESPDWYTPTMPDGRPFSVRVTCWGWDWYLSGYKKSAKPVPDLVHDLAELAWHTVRREDHKRSYPPFEAQTAIVNYYSHTARLGLHRDRQEAELLQVQGSPIITFALGDTGVFQIRDQAGKLHTFDMLHGDALVMFGKGRNLEHGVREILPRSSPIPSVTGRYSITVRQVVCRRERI